MDFIFVKMLSSQEVTKIASPTIQQSGSGQFAFSDTLVKGVVAGMVGGAIFGVQMATMEMLPMVARMIGSQSPAVGFVLHMIISAVIGGIYRVIAPVLAKCFIHTEKLRGCEKYPCNHSATGPTRTHHPEYLHEIAREVFRSTDVFFVL